jgi:SAM-dependent methyltransferase
MNWKLLKWIPWLDTRASFLAKLRRGCKLLDIGSSDGETLRHFFELRPDLQYHATDVAGVPERYPPGTTYYRANIETERLPIGDNSFDAVTCMHLVEHITNLPALLDQIGRVLKPGGAVYFETPHPKTLVLSSPSGASAGTFTINFYDDPTHLGIVPVGRLAALARIAGFHVKRSGVSRNWALALAFPLLVLARPSRKKWTSYVHFIGWSSYLVCEKPAEKGKGSP